MRPSKVHFVGSIGLDSVEEVYRTCGRRLGRRLKRLPDGEPGGRRLWISWQVPLLRASPYLKPVGEQMDLVPLKLAPGVTPAEIRFGELGYCREARASYLDFCAARGRGEQVCAGVRHRDRMRHLAAAHGRDGGAPDRCARRILGGARRPGLNEPRAATSALRSTPIDRLFPTATAGRSVLPAGQSGVRGRCEYRCRTRHGRCCAARCRTCRLESTVSRQDWRRRRRRLVNAKLPDQPSGSSS